MSSGRYALVAELQGLLEAKGHAVDSARRAADRLEMALVDGSIAASPLVDRMLADLHAALAMADGQRLGGKSAEAARFVLRAIVRELERG